MPDGATLVVSVNTSRISSPYTSKEGWAFTCPKCEYIPPVDGIDDYVRIIRTDPSHELYGFARTRNLRYPVRCKPCAAAKKRNQRLRKSMRRIFSMTSGIGCFDATYNYPKLITFALMHEYYSYQDPSEDRSVLIKQLNDVLPKAWRKLLSAGTLGGTFVLECSTKLIWSDLAVEPQMWRHHPHVHCVAVSNFVHHTKLKEYCKQLEHLGLGLINLKAAKSSNTVADYIGKYLAKDNFRARTFGIMRKVPKWERECYCKHDDMSVNATFCDCITTGL